MQLTLLRDWKLGMLLAIRVIRSTDSLGGSRYELQHFDIFVLSDGNFGCKDNLSKLSLKHL